MPVFFIYLIKLSVSLSVVFLFYHFVLRKLTFYNHNRWYLLAYTVISFLVPFINISSVLEKNNWNTNDMISWVPVIHATEAAALPIHTGSEFNMWNAVILVLIVGICIMLFRLFVQFLSFRNMLKKAMQVTTEGMNLYQVNENIIPFSFGNSIFINRHLHNEKELEEIIRHEFVHVKQGHSFDIIWAEILCLLNWFNPFAWLLKRAIRQNLEFIADAKVLAKGADKKEYQYLLLKVIGNNQYSIATQFNFSSLKKRIAMMNKLKSAKANLLRFLFVLPLLAVILLSFRKQLRETLIVRGGTAKFATVFNHDTIPETGNLNGKGYLIEIRKNKKKDNPLVIIKDKDEKEVKRLTIDEWNKRMDYYVNLYGSLPALQQPPDAPSTPPSPHAVSGIDENNPGLEAFLERNPDVKSIGRVYNNINENVVVEAQIFKKDGTIEKYNLKDHADKAKMEKKYGELPLPPPLVPVQVITPAAPVAPFSPVRAAQTISSATPMAETNGDEINLSGISNEYEITDKKAVITLKNGTTEKYDLTNKEERSAFEKKYGKIIHVNSNINTSINSDISSAISASVTPAVIVTATPKASVSTSVSAVIAPAAVRSASSVSTTSTSATPRPASAVAVADDYGYVITGKEDIIITITKTTTRQQLDDFVKQMKTKDIELTFDNIEYNSAGQLTAISGSMKSGDGHSNFVASDFNKLILAMIRKGDRTYFKVSTRDSKEVI